MSSDVAQQGAAADSEVETLPKTFQEQTGIMLEGSQDWHYEDTQPIRPTDVSEGDETLPLQSMLIRTPDEPILINGKPHDISLDQPKLAQAVNNVRTRAGIPGRYEPRGLLITLEEDAQLQLANGLSRERKDVHSWKDGQLHLGAPKEVYSSTDPTEELVDGIERRLNRDLDLGLQQNRALRSGLMIRKVLTRLGLVTSTATGEGIMIANSNSQAIETLIAKGSLGAALGATAAGALIGAKAGIQKLKHGNTAAPVASRAYKRAMKRQQKALAAGNPNPQCRESVITLTPAEE